MKKWIMWAALLNLLAGCGSVGAGLFSSGENISFSFWNASSRELESLAVTKPGEPRVKWASQGGMKPRPSGSKEPSFGGDRYFADNNQKIPEEVDVSWREMPPPGGAPYTGELKGPYRMEVRSRIPPDILKMAGKNGYVLSVTWSMGVEPVKFNWKLESRTFDKNDVGTSKELARGGDS